MNVSKTEKIYWEKKKAFEYRDGIGEYALAKDSEIIKDLLGTHSGMALDFPCGSGRHSFLLKSLGFDVTSADINNSMLKETKRLAQTKTLKMDVFKTNNYKKKFDVVLSSRLLFHYHDQAILLKNLCYLVKPGGVLIIDTLNKGSLRWIIHKFMLLFPLSFIHKSYYSHEKSLVFNSATEIMSLAKKFNLEVVDNRKVYIIPTRLYKYLPDSVINILEFIENRTTSRMKVLTYWKFRLKS